MTENKKKILYIAPLPPPITGHSSVSKLLLENWKQFYRIKVINLAKNTFKQGITSLNRVLAILFLFYKIAKARSGIDYCYFTISQSISGNLKDLIILSILGKKVRNKTIIHLHGGGLRDTVFKKSAILKLLNRLMYRGIGRVVVLSKSLCCIFDNICKLSSIRIVANPVESGLFFDEESIRKKFRSPEKLRLLYLSNLIKGKGYEELLEAFLSLEDEYKANFKLHFAGKHESPVTEEDFLRIIYNNASIKYHGIVADESKKSLLQSSHILLLPTYYSYFEGQPLSILEAYASGNVVVTTNHGGIFDIFTPGINGFEVQKASASSIAEVLKEVFFIRDNLVDYALRNFNDAKTKYSEDIFIAKMNNIITTV